MTPNALNRFLAFSQEFDPHLERLLSPEGNVTGVLKETVHYAALAPGKRIRPYLVVRCCELAGGSTDAAWPAAAAVECVHAFSLIHDDLPAMDNDDVRRGRPTCHKAFGEAAAILAGDALVVLAFEFLARSYPAGTAVQMVVELAQAAGWCGMIGGQAADIAGENQPPARELADFIHGRKTAALFRASCRIGVQVAGGDTLQLEPLGLFGESLGRAFQIADDLLDVTGAADTVGKKTDKDATTGKQTYPRCVGMEQSRVAAAEAMLAAKAAVEPFGSRADDLRELAGFVASRNY